MSTVCMYKIAKMKMLNLKIEIANTKITEPEAAI